MLNASFTGSLIHHAILQILSFIASCCDLEALAATSATLDVLIEENLR